MPDVRILDVTDYVDRSNPALAVPRVLVTYIAPDGRVDSFNMEKTRATRPAIEAQVQKQAQEKLRLTPPINVRYADHLLPPPAPR